MSTFLSTLYRLRPGPSQSFGERILKLLARPAIKLALWKDPDPAVEVNLGLRRLWMNWSHNLPSFLKNYPNYETEIGRLAVFMQARCGTLVMIDVGANVGDTIATLPELSSSKFLCIEGSSKYFNLLVKNYGADPNVCCINALMFDGDTGVVNQNLIEAGGTAHLSKTAGSTEQTVPFETLDNLITRHLQFESANMLKIDTDGFDFRVLKGAVKLLSNSRPALHFELSSWLWQEVGKTDINEALAWLVDAGYRTGILYDNHGYLIGADSFEKPVRMNAFNEYAMRRHDFYLNIIAFHEQSGFMDEFYSMELRHRFC